MDLQQLKWWMSFSTNKAIWKCYKKIDKLMGKMWWNWTKNGHNVLTKSDLFLAHKRSTSNQKEQYELLIRMCPKCCKMIAKLRFEKG